MKPHELSDYVIKEPENEVEMRSMWRLNHEVFAEEYPQHEPSADGCLIDKFHGKNIYRIAWDGEQVVGMISAHWQPPYSAVAKYGQTVERLILPGVTAEIRLFALKKPYRKTQLAIRLACAIMPELVKRGMKRILISGISVQRPFYEHLGLKVVGEPVTENGVVFYPMVGEIDDILNGHLATYSRYVEKL